MLRAMKRLVCLDGLRGVLAVYVMLSHTMPFAPMPGWLQWLFQHGGAAVDMFFILSGLVIVQSLASFEYRALPFLIARVARIYPVFLVVFAFAVAIQPLATSFEHMAWIGQESAARYLWSGGWPSDWALGIATHLTMTHGLFPDGFSNAIWVRFLGTAWSLSTEWQFYFLALLLGYRLGLQRLTALFLVMAACYAVWAATTPEAWHFSRAFLPNKAQYFALGIISAGLIREGRAASHCYLTVLAATLALCVWGGGVDKLLPPLLWTACLAAQAVASAPRPRRSLVETPLRWLAMLLQSRPLVWLGAVSYCLYLVHEPLERLLGLGLASLMQGNAALFTAIWIPGSITLPVLAAWLLHQWIEVPALRAGMALARQSLGAAHTGQLHAVRYQSMRR
ncbi:MAG TPA: acyltransferase, partial [Acetobacteraceae bacterium]|nr:acyltransferase [Acetobacteraceae bacterium]